MTTRRAPESVPKTPWLAAVERAVKAIPRGETASYARVALMAGKPGAARAVVRALHALSDIPWWRVHRSDGTLAPQIAGRQRKLLAAEGVEMGSKRKRGRTTLTAKDRRLTRAPRSSRE